MIANAHSNGVALWNSWRKRNGLRKNLQKGTKSASAGRNAKALKKPVRFFDVEYAVPPALVAGKQKITLRFEAPHGLT